ncbi:MAG TPA: hypothetical protein DCS97_07430 [Planctomycetes bacterium]|nr:hypothetical protein [Planctomycetota bacterium]
MLTKPEFLAALKRETKILSHLAAQLKPRHLAFRFTPPQRSTLELLQYLTINAQAGVGYYLTGSWDHWDDLAAAAKGVNLKNFPAALKVQVKSVQRMLATVSDQEWSSRTVRPMSGKGPSMTLDVALFESTLTTCIGYRMQLFLQAKAAGLSKLGSSDLWAGKH